MNLFNENAIPASNAYRVRITPENAKEWLATRNKVNRAISNELVQRLTRSMKTDRWIDNGQPIILNSEGELIDGQHRLTAIVRSNQAAECLVINDVSDPRAFQTIDDGKKRGLECAVSAMGYANATAVASIGKLFYKIHHASDLEAFLISTHTEQNVVIAEFIDGVPQIVEAAVMARKTKLLCKTRIMGAALTMFLVMNPDKAREFHDLFVRAEYPYENHPVKQLRERFIRDKISSCKMTDLERLAIIFKAWNCWHKEKPIKSLNWSRKKDPAKKFPIPFGWTRS